MGTRALVTLPQDEGAERAMIGCLLVSPEKFARVPLTEDHFHGDVTRQAFCAIRALLERGEPVGLVTVVPEMRRAGSNVGSDVLARFHDEDCFAPEPTFRVLEDQRRRRELVRAADGLRMVALDPTARLEEVVPAALEPLRRALVSHGAHAHTTLLPEALAVRAEALTTGPLEDVERVRTGFAALDGIGGLPRGELTILGARPGMGKSALAQQIALHVARAGQRVLLATPEMSCAQIADRLLAQGADVDLLRLRRGQLSPAEIARVLAVPRAAPPVIVYDQGDMTTADIAGAARGLALRGALDLVVVDHLQYLADPPIKGEGDAVRIGRMTRALKSLARSLDAAMLVCSQLNRDCENRQDKRPVLADFRGSGTIEQDGDLVLALFRSGYYDEDNDDDQRRRREPEPAELGVVKHRNGAQGVRRLVWDGPRMAFYDVHRENGPGPQQELLS